MVLKIMQLCKTMRNVGDDVWAAEEKQEFALVSKFAPFRRRQKFTYGL